MKTLHMTNTPSPTLPTNYPETDNLIQITELAKNIGFNPKKEVFDINKYIPITFLEAWKLFVSKTYQRLLDEKFIRDAESYDPNLVRPLYVFLRPNGKYVIADGQHQSVIGILYTTAGGELILPCQVIEHPKDYTLEECLIEEANRFQGINLRRRSVSVVARLRAEIAIGDAIALKVEEHLKDMGVCIEKIGAEFGTNVYGYTKLMEAYNKYGVLCVTNAIALITKHINDTDAVKWVKNNKPMNGGLIGGIAACYYLLGSLGKGDKALALNTYLEENLKRDKPLGLESLMSGIGGDLQGVFISRRIVTKCNTLITQGYIKKKNGDEFKITIAEDAMDKAGLGDPSNMDKK